jgi:plasmid stability protein
LHNGTVNLTIKNIPDDLYQALKQIAAERGLSLNAVAVQALSEAAAEADRRRSMRETRAALERFVAKMPKLPSSVRLIREERELR